MNALMVLLAGLSNPRIKRTSTLNVLIESLLYFTHTCVLRSCNSMKKSSSKNDACRLRLDLNHSVVHVLRVEECINTTFHVHARMCNGTRVLRFKRL